MIPSRDLFCKVNGELLVDAGFGSNGFYLPFDPAQTGANYSSNAVATGDYFSGDSVSDAFDGNLRTNGFRTTMADSSTATLTFSTPLPVTSSVTIYFYGSDSSNGSAVVNDGTDNVAIDFNTSKTDGTPFTVTGISSLKNIKFISGTGSNSNVGASGIAIDGVLLVDHSSIGVDMSGNNNNFHDQNFGVGDSSQIWSKFNTSANFYSLSNVYGPPSFAFDGSLKTGCLGGNGANDYLPAQFVPDSAIPFNVLKIYVKSFGGQLVTNVGGGGDADVTSTLVDIGNDISVYTNTTPNTLTSVKYNSSGSNYMALVGIEINGEMLIDPLAVDTVLDTPMKNYAVMESGTNGNLQLNGTPGFINSTFNPSGTIYFELTTGANGSGGLMQSLAGVSERSNSLGWSSNVDKYLIVGLTTRDDTIKIKGVNFPEQEIAALNNGTDNVPGSIVSVAYDQANSKVYFAVNNQWINNDLTIAPSGIGDGFDVPSTWTPVVDADNLGQSSSINYGQQPWVHTPPA